MGEKCSYVASSDNSVVINEETVRVRRTRPGVPGWWRARPAGRRGASTQSAASVAGAGPPDTKGCGDFYVKCETRDIFYSLEKPGQRFLNG